jgi:hypothetical protein
MSCEVRARTLHMMVEQTRVALAETRTQAEERHVSEQHVRYQIGNHIGSVTLELSSGGTLIG